MAVPQTLAQVLILLLLVVPGIMFTATRRILKGPSPEDKDFSVRLVNAITASVFFDCIYLIVAGPWIVDQFHLQDADRDILIKQPRQTAIALLVFGLAVPALVAVVSLIRIENNRLSFSERRYPQASAWDARATKRADCFVRIYTADGKWVGGFIPAGGTYISTYPEPRDIFIPEQWKLNDDGEFVRQVKNTLGIYVPLTGNERIAWIAEEQVQPPPVKERRLLPLLLTVALAAAALGWLTRWYWS